MLRTAFLRRSPAVVAVALLASCASWAGRSESAAETQLVATNESDVPQNPAIPAASIAAPSDAADLGNATARLVANDGRADHRELIGPAFWFGGGCAPTGLLSTYGPLADGGAYGTYDGRRSISSWIFVGVALGGDGAAPALFAGRCDYRWLGGTLADGRIAGLAPDATGRDTSLLFTTRRATMPKGGAAAWILGAVLEQVAPARGEDGKNSPRTAKPRPTESPSSQAEQGTTTSATPAKSDDAPAGTSNRAPTGMAKARP